MSDDVELKPCPFCGGKAEIVQIGNDATAKRGYEVRCLTWGCATKKRAMVIRQPMEKAQAFAANAWNTRAALTSSRSSNDEIVEVLEPFADKVRQFSEQPNGIALIQMDFAHFRRAAALLSKVKEQG